MFSRLSWNVGLNSQPFPLHAVAISKLVNQRLGQMYHGIFQTGVVEVRITMIDDVLNERPL